MESYWLVSMSNQLRRTEQLPLKETVRKGAGLRLYSDGLSTIPGSKIQPPLATVVVGGLISANVLTLYLLPILYPFFAGKI